MAKNLSNIRQDVRQKLQDEFIAGTYQIWPDDELNQYIEESLAEYSSVIPYKSVELVPVTSGSKVLDISDIEGLISIKKAEYPAGENPRSYRNVIEIDPQTVEIDISSAPTTGGGSGHLTGTVTFTHGSTAITGAATLFTTELAAGYYIKPSTGSRWYRIASITSATALTLVDPVLDATGADTVSVTDYCYEVAILHCNKIHTLTESESTLNPVEESLIVIGATGIAASSKPMKFYQQSNTSLANLDTASTELGNISARLTQAITDVGNGRTEVAKVPAIITTAAGVIASMSTVIGRAVTDIGSGRTELAKIPAIIDEANTELDKIGAQITLAKTVIATSKTELDKITTTLGTVDTALGKIDAEVLQSVTDLDSGRALISGIDTVHAASSYQNYAQTGVGNANGYANEAMAYIRKANALETESGGYIGNAHGNIATAQAYLNEAIGYIRQGGADGQTAAGYLASAGRELNAAGEYLSQANGYFQQARAEESAAASFNSQANHELSIANSQAGRANGYLRLISSRLSISSSGKAMESWGTNQKAEFRAKINRMVKPRKYTAYSTN